MGPCCCLRNGRSGCHRSSPIGNSKLILRHAILSTVHPVRLLLALRFSAFFAPSALKGNVRTSREKRMIPKRSPPRWVWLRFCRPALCVKQRRSSTSKATNDPEPHASEGSFVGERSVGSIQPLRQAQGRRREPQRDWKDALSGFRGYGALAS